MRQNECALLGRALESYAALFLSYCSLRQSGTFSLSASEAVGELLGVLGAERTPLGEFEVVWCGVKMRHRVEHWLSQIEDARW